MPTLSDLAYEMVLAHDKQHEPPAELVEAVRGVGAFSMTIAPKCGPDDEFPRWHTRRLRMMACSEWLGFRRDGLSKQGAEALRRLDLICSAAESSLDAAIERALEDATHDTNE